MDILTIDVLSVLIGLFIFLLSFIITKRWRTLRTFKRMGIPGPEPSFLFGNLRDIEKFKNRLLLMQEWINKYGKVLGYYEGVTPVLLIADLEMIKTIFIKEFHLFTNRSNLPLKLPSPFCNSLNRLDDDDWRRVRNSLTPAFSGKKLKQMSEIMNKSVKNMLEVIEEKAQKELEFDIYELFQSLTMQVIGESVFAVKVDCFRDPNNSFLLYSRLFFKQLNSVFIKVGFAVPFLGNLIFRMAFKFSLWDAGKPHKFLIRILKEVIKQRRQNKEKNTVDMLQLMIDAAHLDDENIENGVGNSSQANHTMTENELIGNSFVFLLAGFETTANTLAYTAYNLAKYMDTQKQVQAEVDIALEKHKQPDYDIVNNMNKLNEVISESLRLYPPVTLFTTRICSQNCNINGLQIPKGIKVLLPVWQIHHDTDLWSNPEEFHPERFSPENKSELQSLAWVPFGIGPRNCIGMRFALLEIKTALALILRDYTLIPGEKYEDPLQLKCSMLLMNPKNGVFVKAVKRHN